MASRRKATIVIDAEQKQARASLENLEEGLEDVEVQSRQTEQAVKDVASPSAVARIEALQSRVNELGDELDRTSRKSRNTGSSFAHAAGEAGEVLEVIMQLDPAAKTALASVVGLAGALGAAGGLATVATVAAVKLGPEGLQRDIKDVGLSAKAAGRDFSMEFAPTIREEVIPALNRMIRKLQNADDELASFSKSTLEFSRQTANAPEASWAGLALRGPIGLLEGVARRQGMGTTADVLDVLNVSGNLTELIFEDPESGGSTTPAFQRLLDQQDRVRRSIIDRGGILRQVGVPEQQVLETQISALEKIREKLVQFAETADGEAREKVVSALQAYQREIFRLRSQMSGLNQQAPSVSPVDLPSGGDSTQRLPTTLRDLGAPPAVPTTGGGAFDRIAPGLARARRAQRAGMARAASRQAQGVTASARQAFMRGDLSLEKFRALNKASQEFIQKTQTMDRSIGRLISAGGQLGQVLARAFQKGNVEATNLIGSILQATGGVLTAIPGVGQIAGPTLGAVGGIIGQFEHGGRVPRTGTAIVGEAGPEMVTLPKGTQVHTNRETRAMMDTSALEAEVRALREQMGRREIVLPISATREELIHEDKRQAQKDGRPKIINTANVE